VAGSGPGAAAFDPFPERGDEVVAAPEEAIPMLDIGLCM
jgi:hypothetical protein